MRDTVHVRGASLVVTVPVQRRRLGTQRVLNVHHHTVTKTYLHHTQQKRFYTRRRTKCPLLACSLMREEYRVFDAIVTGCHGIDIKERKVSDVFMIHT